MYLLAKIGVDTAENEFLKVHLIFKLWGLIFTESPRPSMQANQHTAVRAPSRVVPIAAHQAFPAMRREQRSTSWPATISSLSSSAWVPLSSWRKEMVRAARTLETSIQWVKRICATNSVAPLLQYSLEPPGSISLKFGLRTGSPSLHAASIYASIVFS